MLNKGSIRNFKCLHDVQIDLERFTVFVGPNASGKSSILQGLDLLCRTFGGQEQSLEGELLQALSRGSNDSVELAAECGRRCYRYRTRSASSPGNVGAPGFIFPGQAWAGLGRGVALDLKSSDWKHWPPKQNDPSPLPLSVLLRLETSKLISFNPTNPVVSYQR